LFIVLYLYSEMSLITVWCT